MVKDLYPKFESVGFYDAKLINCPDTCKFISPLSQALIPHVHNFPFPHIPHIPLDTAQAQGLTE